MTRSLLFATIPLAFVFAGCAPDARPLLSDCDYGLYWADCGGEGEPVIGCDRETGDCRWFRGGLTARNHAASDCSPELACCHYNYPFTDFTPDDDIRPHVVEQLALLPISVIEADDLHLEPRLRNDVSVYADLTDTTTPGLITCTSGCLDSASGATHLERVGSSLVARFNFSGGRWELEILPRGPIEQWSARIFQFVDGARDVPTPPPLACSNYWSAGSSYVVVGELHINTDDLSDLDAVHGRLTATLTVGGPRVEVSRMEF